MVQTRTPGPTGLLLAMTALLLVLATTAAACTFVDPAPDGPGAYFLWDHVTGEHQTIVVEDGSRGCSTGHAPVALDGGRFVWLEPKGLHRRLMAFDKATQATSLVLTPAGVEVGLDGDVFVQSDDTEVTILSQQGSRQSAVPLPTPAQGQWHLVRLQGGVSTWQSGGDEEGIAVYDHKAGRFLVPPSQASELEGSLEAAWPLVANERWLVVEAVNASDAYAAALDLRSRELVRLPVPGLGLRYAVLAMHEDTLWLEEGDGLMRLRLPDGLPEPVQAPYAFAGAVHGDTLVLAAPHALGPWASELVDDKPSPVGPLLVVVAGVLAAAGIRRRQSGT